LGTLGGVKRLAKIIGVVGGLAAIVWAMRDRFISVATSREPEPPTFRASDAKSGTTGIDVIDGIGPVFASRLKDAGIDTPGKLGAASPDRVAEAAGVSGARARAWIEQARGID
jgi:polyhydroxyalkanoate synthase